jgi:hypothetical protein
VQTLTGKFHFSFDHSCVFTIESWHTNVSALITAQLFYLFWQEKRYHILHGAVQKDMLIQKQ